MTTGKDSHSQGPDSAQDVDAVRNTPALRDLSVVYQPIIDMRSREVFAYEALARSCSPGFEYPPNLFTGAIQYQCCGLLGRVLRELALSGCPSWPLFLNVHPHEFDERWLVQPNDPIFRHEHPIYLEITESVPLSHYRLCHSVLQEIRSKGIYLAVDDLGAGYSNLKYIADLSPEIVKLDRELIVNLTQDKRRHRLVTSIVRLCMDMGARVIAEGIETRDELHAVEDTGVHYCQGFLISRPAFPPPRPSSLKFRAAPRN